MSRDGLRVGVAGNPATQVQLDSLESRAAMRDGLALCGAGNWTVQSPVNGAFALSANRLYFVPVRVPRLTPILDGLCSEVTVAGVGTAMILKFGVWAPDDAGMPGALLAGPAATVDPTTTGQKSVTGLGIDLTAQRVVWLGVVGQASVWTTAPTLTRHVGSSASTPLSWGATLTDALSRVWPARTPVSGAMPDPAAPNSSGANIPTIAAQFI